MTESRIDRLVRRRRFDDRALPTTGPGMVPSELVWEILKLLPVKSLMRFKCVSRTWWSIITNPVFAKGYHGGFRGLLIVEPNLFRLADSRHFFYVSLDGPESRISHHVSFDDAGTRVGYTDIVNGLVCFYHRRFSDLYNIATRERMQLPYSANEALACSYHLGFDPVSKLYKLLKICPVYDNYDDNDLSADDVADFVCNLNCEILTIGLDSAWRSIDPPPMEITTRSVCLDGDLYWMEPISRSLNCLIAFHISGEKFQIVTTPGENTHFNLPRFGTSLALTSVMIRRFRQALMIPYVKGNGGKSESGMWGDQQQFVVPVLDRYEFYPHGVLPNGKVVIFDSLSVKDYPAPLYLFDPSKRKYEKIMIDTTPSSEELLMQGGFQGMFYLEENIMPLRYLNFKN